MHPILDCINSGRKWAILQAENPGNKRLTDDENYLLTEDLHVALFSHRLAYHSVEGHTKDVPGEVEHAYFVFDIEHNVAVRLAKTFGQWGIIHSGGLVEIASGKVTPLAGGVITGEAAREYQYYTVIKTTTGDIPFHILLAGEERPSETQHHFYTPSMD